MNNLLLFMWGLITGGGIVYIMHLIDVKKLVEANQSLIEANNKLIKILNETEQMLKQLAISFKSIK